jgi:hypothetical protein
VANGVVTNGVTTGVFTNGLRFLDNVWAHDGQTVTYKVKAFYERRDYAGHYYCWG